MRKKRNNILGLVSLFIFSACAEVEIGHEGYFYRPYGEGLDEQTVYENGIHSCAPWNDIHQVNTQEQSVNIQSEVLDKNGLGVTISVSANFSVRNGEGGMLLSEVGTKYVEKIVNPIAKGAIKDVAGRYGAEELYSTKREKLETEIEDIVKKAIEKKHLHLYFVEVADVDLPPVISKAIERKEEQEQKNSLAEKRKIEATNNAIAQYERAKGDSLADVTRAAGAAEAYKKKRLELNDNLIKQQFIDKWDGKLPVYGQTPTIFKQIK